MQTATHLLAVVPAAGALEAPRARDADGELANALHLQRRGVLCRRRLCGAVHKLHLCIQVST